MENLGKYLREHREAKGITLEEIEGVSNISVFYLRALEEGQIHILPAPTFTVGFLRQYARCIGLDQEDVVLRYRAVALQDGERIRERSTEKMRRGRMRSIWIVGASLFLLGLLWVVLYPGTEMTGERVRTIRMPRTSVKEIKKERLRKELDLLDDSSPREALDEGGSPALSNIGGTDGKNSVSPTKTGAVEVILQALEETKVQIILDSEPTYEKVLEPGERHSCRAKKRVKLQIGNGSGVRIFYKGRVYENLGKKGDVVHISFPPSESG